MLAGEALVGQHVIPSPAHQIRELWMARLERIDQLGPVLFRCGRRVLVKGGSERRAEDWLALLADASKFVAQEVDAAALDGRTFVNLIPDIIVSLLPKSPSKVSTNLGAIQSFGVAAKRLDASMWPFQTMSSAALSERVVSSSQRKIVRLIVFMILLARAAAI